MTGSAGTAMDVVLRRRKAYKGGSLREGGSKIPPDVRLADSLTSFFTIPWDDLYPSFPGFS